MNIRADLAIVGSGFAGSLLAMIARQLGRSVLLLERQRHPRFAIGESSTPLANLLLEELAQRYDLIELLPFTKWGPWQRQRAEVRCGLKRGFTFYHHERAQPWIPRSDRTNELLVAASPHDEIADTHWYRADFDQAFARFAVQHGAELLDNTTLDSFQTNAAGEAVVEGRTSSNRVTVRAKFLVDASGPRGFLARALALPETPLPWMPATQTLYTHFTGVRRWDDLHPSSDRPPYPPDDAALHHVFAGGWIWVLRFAHGVTSAGVAATDSLASDLRLADGAEGWRRLLARFPSIAEQFADATPCHPFCHQPRASYRAGRVVGPNWALLPSAAGFVDPLLSTGFPLTLLGVERLARSLAEDWNSARWSSGLDAYAARTLEELDRTADLIGALYRRLGDFKEFVPTALLYFAAASYTETARRLGRTSLADGFLLGKHPDFAPALARCVGAPAAHPDDLSRAIELVNIAGLGKAGRRNWYPALAEDLLEAKDKLGVDVDPAEIKAMLQRAGF